MTDSDWGYHVFHPTRDDHTQYARTDGTRAFTGGVTITGTADVTSDLTVGGAATVTGDLTAANVPNSINGASNTPNAAAGNKIQSGSFTAAFSSAAAVTGTLTFPVAFTTAPIVIATVQVGASSSVNVNWQSAPTATAVAWRAFQTSGSSITVTATVHWIAIGT